MMGDSSKSVWDIHFETNLKRSLLESCKIRRENLVFDIESLRALKKREETSIDRRRRLLAAL